MLPNVCVCVCVPEEQKNARASGDFLSVLQGAILLHQRHVQTKPVFLARGVHLRPDYGEAKPFLATCSAFCCILSTQRSAVPNQLACPDPPGSPQSYIVPAASLAVPDAKTPLRYSFTTCHWLRQRALPSFFVSFELSAGAKKAAKDLANGIR